MGKSNGEHMGPEAISTESSQNFPVIANLFFKAEYSCGLGQHRFALSGDLVLDHYTLSRSTLAQFFFLGAQGD